MNSEHTALIAWQEHFEKWAAAENELRQLSPEAKEELSENLRRWWEITSELLLAAVHLEVHFGLHPDPSPHELLAKLSVMSADLANGNIPVLVSGVVTGGRPKTWDAERRDIGRAVRYVEAAKAGTVNDRRPNATVREEFGVSAPTVRQWCQDREYYMRRLPDLADWPDRIDREMREAGERYKSWGRGVEALRQRAKMKKVG